jgi:hypothetical protein
MMGKLKKKLDILTQQIDKNAEVIFELTDKILDSYISSFDDFVEEWEGVMNNKKHPPTDEEINNMILQLPTFITYLLTGAFEVGVKSDVASAIKTEAYNKAYLESTGKTIDARKAEAELNTLEEIVIQSAYKRSVELLNSKIKSGYELINSGKKVITVRTTEMELTNENRKGRRR